MVSSSIKISLNYRNEYSKTDAEYVVQVAKTLLTPMGIWPLYRGDSFEDKLKTALQTGSLFTLMCFLLLPHVIYTFLDCEDLTRYMKVIAAQVFSLLAIIKFWTMVFNKKEIRFCLEKMEKHYRNVECEEDRQVMKKCAKVGRLFTVAYLGLSYGGALPYHIVMPLAGERIIKDDNTTQIPLPYLSDYVFFEVDSSPFYEILFVSQILISSIILSTNCGVYSLIANTVMHCCCLFEVVCRQIETICQYRAATLEKRLGDIVRNHIKAIEYAQIIENSLSIVFLSEMVGCTIIICFLEYGVLKEWEEHQTLGMGTYFVLMTSIFVNVFIISFIGDRLKEESARVGEVAYFMEWYGLPSHVIKNLIVIIIRASRPSTLTAGKLFDLSLLGFCDVCKTSAAYLNFIRTMVSQS